MKEQKIILQKVIDLIKKNKATGDVIFDQGKSLSFKAHDGELEKYEVSSSAVIGVRIIKNERVGTSFSEAIDDDSLEIMVKQAIDYASFSKEDPHQKIICEKSEKHENNPACNSKETIDAEQMIEMCLKLESLPKKRDSRVKSSPYNGLSEGSSTWFYMNTNGAFRSESSRYFSATSSVLMQEEGKNTSFYEGSVKRNFSDLDIDHLVDESIFHASEFLKGEQVETGKYNIVFSPRTFSSFFGVFSNIFSAESTIEGKNPLFEKLGEQIAHPELSLIDRPHFERGFNNQSFDSEGMETSDTELIKNGQYCGLLQNSKTASELKMKNTHNAARSARGSLNVSFSNKVFNLGSTKEEEINQMDHLEIVEIQGLHSGANSISGEFSFPISGYLYRNGKKEKVVKGVTLSGNFFKALNDITHVGDKLHSNSMGTVFMPKIVFSNLSIAGL
ncbi:TldD/PmbA family protein [Halobacteriovorax sp. GB3]|uniref:TldD/PmbA family protein n=1 Tax=Halobacteriovorax sp. GB3 TaxID=2719615 RepID=UPI002361F115|nr:TldD/PmbA family protein [Halobacteriovorax sp. GB3]MDD0852903.1 TldD/PmbA family protein [Halobacteriovorax sp. GB3]